MKISGKKIGKRLLALVFAVTMLLTQIPVTAVYASEPDSTDDGLIEYLAVESGYIEETGTQKFVMGISGGQKIDSAVLVIKNETTGKEYQTTSQEVDTDRVLFQMTFSGEEDRGVYSLSRVTLVSEEEITVDLQKIGIEAKFGVGVEIQTDPDAVTYNSEDDDNGDVNVQIFSVDDGSEVSESELSQAMASAAGSTPRKAARLMAEPQKNGVVIVLDPGHDSTHAGNQQNGLSEEKLTLKIARYCKEELETYQGVTVYMTRETETCAYKDPSTGKNVSTSECNVKRTEYAKSVNADFFISFHMNSTKNDPNPKGVEVYYPNANYNASVGAAGKDMAEKVLAELVDLGLVSRGTKLNDDDGYTYPDGSRADDYTVINKNKLNGIPAILIEHAFQSNKEDVEEFLNSEEKLQKLGVADATGIAKYFGLNKAYDTTGISITSAVNNRERTCDLSVSGMPEVYSAQIAVWSDVGGLDDMQWYDLSKGSDGIWSAKVDLNDHSGSGTYHAHLYAVDEKGQGAFLSGQAFDVTGISVDGMQISGVDQGKGTFNVILSDITTLAGIKKVSLAAWTKGDQSDLHWYQAIKQKDGTYQVTVDMVNHAYHYGQYQLHAYVTDEQGTEGFGAATSYTLRPGSSWKVEGDETKRQISLVNAGYGTGITSMKFAVWSEQNGQDDLIWYPAAWDYATGNWKAEVDLKDHKTAGVYQVHAYAVLKNKETRCVSTGTFTVEGPKAESIAVSNAKPLEGTFTVTVKGVTAQTGISKVKVAAWVSDDQSDLRWYQAIEQKDGTYQVTIDIANHKYHYGKFKIHAYITDKLGMEGFGAGASYSFRPDSSWNITGEGTDRDIELVDIGYGYGITSMKFAVWSEQNGQDDLIWYPATWDYATGNWKVQVDLKKHKTAGVYQVHAYAVLKNKETRCVSTGSFSVEGPKAESMEISDADPSRGTFMVTVKGVTAQMGISRVRVAAWVSDDQSDLHWYEAVKQKDGTYQVTVDIANHKYHYGKYQMHTYITDGAGIQGFGAGKTYSLQPDSSWKITGGNTKRDIQLVNVGYGTGITSMKFAVWSEKNGQDDLIWYPATWDYATGNWKVQVSLKDHKTAGNYQVHAYAVLKNKESRCVGTTTFTVEGPKAEGVTLGEKNEEAGLFTVEIQKPSSGAKIVSVQTAVWSQADQSDIRWYDATKGADDIYYVYVDIANHGNNLGKYQAHVYVTDENEIRGMVGSTTCNIVTAGNGFYNIKGSSVVTEDQLVGYFSSKASYPSFYADSDAPTLEDFCRIYVEECNAEGIKVEVAFAQAMNETGFLKYGGMVKISQYNFAGIGAVDNGTVAPATFSSVREGVRAHVQHLKAYACKDPLNQECVDPRFSLVKRGSAPYVEWLGIQENPDGYGWASMKNYGYNIRDKYIAEILKY